MNAVSHSPGSTASHRARADFGAVAGHEASHSKPTAVLLILETSRSVTPNLPEGPEVPLSATVSPGLRLNVSPKAPLAEFKKAGLPQRAGHVLWQEKEPPSPERLIYSPRDGILRANRWRRNGVKSGMRKGSQQQGSGGLGAGDSDRRPICLRL